MRYRIGLALMAALCPHAPRAQPAPGICDALPPAAVTSVPAPFDAYMRLMCRNPTGQGLQPVPGTRWIAPGGAPIALSSTSMAGPAAPDGSRRFPPSWYVSLAPVSLSATEQRQMRLDLRRGVRPQFLENTSILEMRATTSNKETKLIVLVLPRAMAARPQQLVGLECNGTCFRQDAEPLMFAGAPE